MSRTNSVIGYLGPRKVQAFTIVWNALFTRLNAPAMLDFYPTSACGNDPCAEKQCLHLRLSEMFLLGRRGYIVDPALQSDAYELMDEHDATARKHKKVDTVVSENGVQKGFFCGLTDSDPMKPLSTQYRILFGTDVSAEDLEYIQRKLPGHNSSVQ